MIKRVVRLAGSFEEADAMDRSDYAAMTMAERFAMVEEIRAQAFALYGRPQRRLERVVVVADLGELE